MELLILFLTCILVIAHFVLILRGIESGKVERHRQGAIVGDGVGCTGDGGGCSSDGGCG
jgi:hypothetical protein